MADPYLYQRDVNWGLLRLWGGRCGLEVLDLGCGFADTSTRIQDLGNRVTGIDCSPDAAAVAVTRLERVALLDFTDLEAVKQALGDARYDVIIFADVLEHLADPAWALDAYLGRLKPGGTVLVSLPNVGLWSVRLGLLLGRWNYSDTGVLDRTHLRFFTWRTARALLAAAGIRPLRRTLNPGLARPFLPLAKRFLVRGHGERRPDPMTMLNSGAYRWYLRLVHPTEHLAAWLWPGGLAFQMVFEGKVEET